MVTASQDIAFSDATTGFTMSQFNLTILLIFYSLLYLWMVWVIVTQWKAWANRKIAFYDFLVRSVRSVFITLVLGYFLY